MNTKKLLGVISPLIILAIGLIIGIGATFAYFQFKPQTKPQPILQPSPNAPSAAQSPSPDETANWETYSDQKLKFSIKYPNDVVILRSFTEGGLIFAKVKDANQDFRAITTLEIYFRGDVGTSPQQALKNECPIRNGQPCEEKFEPVTINNASGIKTLGPYYPSDNNYYLTNQNGQGKVVRLTIFLKPNNPNDDIEQFKKMVSTFKFLN